MTDDTQRAQKGRRAGFGFIFASSVMNSISFGIMIPILPNLIVQFTGGNSASASLWNTLFMVSWGLMQFVIGPVLGMMSDRFGRRPVLLLSLFGLAVDFLFMAFAPSLMWLLVGRVLNGMTAASFSTANAYAADVTPPEERAKVFGWMGSAFSFGFVFGPFLGGWLGGFDLRLPFLVAAGLTAVNFLYGLLVLPESLAPDRRIARFDWSKANPFGSLKLLGAHRDLAGLAGVYLIYQVAHMVLPSIFVLYTGYRYGWTPLAMGAQMAVTGVLGIVVSIFLVAPVVRRIGERGAVLLGALCGAAGFAIYGAAPTTALYLVGMPVFAGMGFLVPGLMGLMSRRVGPHEQGQLQGANQSLSGIASIAGPMIFGPVYAWSVDHDSTVHMPGLAIWVAGALLLLAFAISLAVARPVSTQTEPARA